MKLTQRERQILAAAAAVVLVAVDLGWVPQPWAQLLAVVLTGGGTLYVARPEPPSYPKGEPLSTVLAPYGYAVPVGPAPEPPAAPEPAPQPAPAPEPPTTGGVPEQRAESVLSPVLPVRSGGNPWFGHHPWWSSLPSSALPGAPEATLTEPRTGRHRL